MTGDWSTGRLGDCILLRSGGTPSKSRPDFWTGDVPWVSAKDMKSYWIEDTEDHLSEAGAGQAARIVEGGTTLLLVRGMTLHNDIPICRVRYAAAFNQDVKAVLARSGTDPDLVPYLLLGNKAKLLSMVDSAGHGTGRLNSDTLLNLPVHIPPIEEQRTIARILGTLDDKIELNRRMNETLEEMARAIFKSWFVDFDPVRAKAEGRDPGLPKHMADLFPDRFEDSELGQIPAGWKAAALSEAIEVNPRRSLKKGEAAPYLDMKNMPTQSARALHAYEREFGSGVRFTNDDTLVARITPCLENGKTCFVDFLGAGSIGWGSTEYIVLRPKPPLPAEFAYFLARTEKFRTNAISNMSGTSGRQRVPAESFNQFKLAVPPAKVAGFFGEFARTIISSMRTRDAESHTLAALRNSLLPRLISGELRVTDARRYIKVRP